MKYAIFVFLAICLFVGCFAWAAVSVGARAEKRMKKIIDKANGDNTNN